MKRKMLCALLGLCLLAGCTSGAESVREESRDPTSTSQVEEAAYTPITMDAFTGLYQQLGTHCTPEMLLEYDSEFALAAEENGRAAYRREGITLGGMRGALLVTLDIEGHGKPANTVDGVEFWAYDPAEAAAQALLEAVNYSGYSYSAAEAEPEWRHANEMAAPGTGAWFHVYNDWEWEYDGRYVEGLYYGAGTAPAGLLPHPAYETALMLRAAYDYMAMPVFDWPEHMAAQYLLEMAENYFPPPVEAVKVLEAYSDGAQYTLIVRTQEVYSQNRAYYACILEDSDVTAAQPYRLVSTTPYDPPAFDGEPSALEQQALVLTEHLVKFALSGWRDSERPRFTEREVLDVLLTLDWYSDDENHPYRDIAQYMEEDEWISYFVSEADAQRFAWQLFGIEGWAFEAEDIRPAPGDRYIRIQGAGGPNAPYGLRFPHVTQPEEDIYRVEFYLTDTGFYPGDHEYGLHHITYIAMEDEQGVAFLRITSLGKVE